MKKVIITLVCIVSLGAVGYVFTIGMGKPIGSDLSILAQGRPALVLAYENFSPAGGTALNRLRNVRSDFDSRLDFVIADLGTPSGTAFANRHRLVDGLAVFLDRRGQPILVTVIPTDEQELRNLLESTLTKS